jgi:hypothetical protein
MSAVAEKSVDEDNGPFAYVKAFRSHQAHVGE